MVKVREDYPIRPDGTVDLEAWLNRLSSRFGLSEIGRLREACALCCQVEQKPNKYTTEDVFLATTSCFKTGLEMVSILAKLKLDMNSLVAAVLYRTVREHKLSLQQVEEACGQAVAHLIENVQGMAAISTALNPLKKQRPNQQQDQLDKVRKMLVAIIDDVRVALIKLAERTCAIRAVKDANAEKQQRVAREVFEIYAPLAHRLGIGYIKWELEDLSFRYLQPQEYKKIARLLDEKRLTREQYIDDVVATLRGALAEAQIHADVFGRAKHIYSIWRKMRRKSVSFRDLRDIRAVRILTHEVQDCYTALGTVHSLWHHIPQEFDDYITTPKENGYRSLHTAVFGPEGKTLEVQIRTQAMHEEAELGVCAHWKYKGRDTNRDNASYEEKVAWLRQVMEWHEDLGDLGGIGHQWRADVEPDRIYVFTKDGHVIELPVGATPIDFAYRIHTEIGQTCRGAKVAGRIVPLNHTLKTGDQVEILTAANSHPSRDWLNPDLGYIVTTRARAKITSWFNKQDRDSHIADGRRLLEAELRRLALHRVDTRALAQTAHYTTADDLYAGIGAGDVKLSQVLGLAQQQLDPEQEQPLNIQPSSRPPASADTIHIDGVGNLLTQMAKCCQPIPGDAIIGYITVGRGVTVHRQDCSNALFLQEQEPERLIEVNWGNTTDASVYPIELMITAYDRPGLLRDITLVLANEKINVLALRTQMHKDDYTARLLLTVAVHSIRQLRRVLAKVNQLPNVAEAVRYRKENDAGSDQAAT